MHYLRISGWLCLVNHPVYLIVCVENDFSVAENRQQRQQKTEHTIQDL